MGMESFARFLKGFYKSLIWGLIILFICLIPSNKVDNVRLFNFDHFDKIVHFLFYYILTLIFYADIFKYFKAPGKKYFIYLYVVLIPLFWGIIIELLQYYVVASREGSIFDIAANICGIIAGSFTVLILRNYLPKSDL